MRKRSPERAIPELSGGTFASMISRRSFRLSAFACAAALAGVACGGGGASEPGAESAPVATQSGESAGDSASEATDGSVPTLLQFTAPLVGGGEFVGDRFADKPTAFWFWAPT